jgi:ABC-type uncharacterized transport system auxiliary subunit
MPSGRFVERAWRPLLACALLGMLGCASGPAPRDHYYRLEVEPPQSARKPPILDGTLEVGRFRADALTGERQILYRETEDATEVQRHPYHRWGDPPPNMLQVQMTSYLRAANAADRVVMPEVRVRPDFLLVGRIIRLERVLEGSAPRVVVVLELSITRAARGEIVVHETYRERRTATGTGTDEAVRAFDAAISAIFERFVAEIPDTPTRQPE